MIVVAAYAFALVAMIAPEPSGSSQAAVSAQCSPWSIGASPLDVDISLGYDQIGFDYRAVLPTSEPVVQDLLEHPEHAEGFVVAEAGQVSVDNTHFNQGGRDNIFS